MLIHPVNRRRVFGAACLLIAMGMLAGDELLFRGWLEGGPLLAYWLTCFGFTLLAMIAAYLDVRALRRQTRQAQRELIEATFRGIGERGRDAAHRPKP